MSNYIPIIYPFMVMVLFTGICGCEVQEDSVVSPERTAANLQSAELERIGLLAPGGADGDDSAGSWVSEKRILELLDMDKPETGKPSIAIEQVDHNPDANQSMPAKVRHLKAEGLEAAKGWRAVSWSMPSQVRIARAQEHGAEGMLLVIEPKPSQAKDKQKDKAAVILPTPAIGKLRAGMQVTLSAVCSGAESVLLAVALEVGPSRTYYESNAIVVSKGKERSISLPLAAKIWKTEATSWRFESAVKSARLRSMMILLYHPIVGTRVTVDRIFIR